jgi:DNA-3-methyladenine glycosylase
MNKVYVIPAKAGIRKIIGGLDPGFRRDDNLYFVRYPEIVRRILPENFFNRPTLAVARGLPGKYLVRKYRGKTIALLITEVEAYDGPGDLASHASRGRTPRTKIMFGAAGRFYVYFTYGMHWLVNIVTGPKNYPAAVLIRAGKYYDPRKSALVSVNGPARLTKFLHIARAQNGKVSSRKTCLWFEDRGIKINRRDIVAGKRIGVDYAGPVWKNKFYRFGLESVRLDARGKNLIKKS